MSEPQAREARSNGRRPRPSAPGKRHIRTYWRAVLTPVAVGSILLLGSARVMPPAARLAASVSFLYPGFGSGGVDLLTPSSQSAQAQAAAPVPPCPASGTCAWSGIANDVVAAGYEGTGSGGGTLLALAVVNQTTGANSPTFNGGAVLTDGLGEPTSSTVQATGVAVYPACPVSIPSCAWSSEAGDIVVVGTVTPQGSLNASVVVAAYGPTGTALWNQDLTPLGAGSTPTYVAATSPALALETTGPSPTGDVLVGGAVFETTPNSTPQEAFLAAVTPASGALDPTFGGGAGNPEIGFVLPTPSSSPASEAFASVAVDSAGDIVAGGSFVDSSSGNTSALVARYTAGGTYDPRFGPPTSGVSACLPAAVPVAGFTTTSASPNVTTTASVTSVVPGMLVSGTGIPAGTTVASVTTGSPSTVTLSQAATASGSGVTLSFASALPLTGFTATAASTSVTTSTSVANVVPGMLVSGNGIPAGTTVISVASGSPNTVNLSQAATASASGVLLDFSSALPVTGVATTAGSASVTTSASVAHVVAGMLVSGSGIPAGTTVVSVISGSPSTVNLSQAATGTATGVTLDFSVPGCSGSALVTSATNSVFGSAMTIEPVAGSCPNQPACYDVLVAGTYVPGTGSSSEAVAAVTQSGTPPPATSWGGGLVKLPATSTNQTGTGIAYQSTGGIVTGVMISGYVSASTTNGVGTVSRLTPTGALVTSFGTNGSYAIPSGTAYDSKSFAMTTDPGSLDFVVAGAFLGSTDKVTRFGLARVIGEVLTLTATISRDPHAANTDYVTITVTAPAAIASAISVGYALGSVAGLTFAPTSGSITIPAGRTTASAAPVVYFPPLIGNQWVVIATSPGSGLTALTSPSSLRVAAGSPFGPPPSPNGYWMTTQQGAVYSFGRIPYYGGTSRPPAPIVSLAEAPNGTGYWMVNSRGNVYAEHVPYHGGYSGTPPSPIVAIAEDPANGGYWLFSRAGAIYGYGGAPNYGQGSHLAGPVAYGAAAPDGLGYWLVTTNGFVYGYGPGAHYYGGASRPAAPIVSMAADLYTGGYWLLTSKGVVYGLNAPNYGSASGQNTTSITADPAVNGGYWISVSNGGVYSFKAPYLGSAAGDHPNSALISILGR